MLPHIILIIMDSVAAKRCSVYGHHRRTTPGLARIAAEGVLYRYCFAPASWTLPSHVSLFSGLYPSQHGCNHPGKLDYPGNYHLLPEILQNLGYRTLGISSNYAISRACHFHTGFDEYYDMDTLFNSDRYVEMRQFIKSSRPALKNDLEEVKFILKASLKNRFFSYPLRHLLDRVYRKLWGDVITRSCYATARSLHLAKRLVKRYRERPFFLFMNFMEAHNAYRPPRRYRKALGADETEGNPGQLPYEQEIAYLDDCLWNLYSFLDRLGLKDRTLFAVTADHGEGFGEHGVGGHNFSVYNELIHIPLIVKYPRDLGRQGATDRLAQLHDLFATVLEVAGAPLPAPESSASLLGPGREFALAENLDTLELVHLKHGPAYQPKAWMQPCLALVDAELHKLIKWADGRLELYDLRKDYGETTNLVSHPAYRDRAEDLHRLLGKVSVPLAG